MAMKKILDYIYTSEIELDLDCVHEVLIAATLVQVAYSSSAELRFFNMRLLQLIFALLFFQD